MRAGFLIELNRVDEAIAELSAAIDGGHPEPDHLCSRVAKIHLLQGHTDEAVSWYRRAVGWADERWKRSERGWDALAEGRPFGIPLALAGLSTSPAHVSTRVKLLEALIAAHQLDDARSVAHEIDDLDHARHDSPLARARILFVEGKAEEAERLADEEAHIVRSPEDVAGWLEDFATLLQRFGPADAAPAVLKVALRIRNQ